MRKTFTLLISLILLGAWSQEVMSQTYPTYPELQPVLEQLDENQRATFFDELETLLDMIDVDMFNLQEAMDSLFQTDVSNAVPGLPVDSFTVEWGAGLDSLVSFVIASGVGSEDSTAIIDHRCHRQLIYSDIPA